MNYPELLEPDGTIGLPRRDPVVEVSLKRLLLKEWTGELLLNRFGGKPLIAVGEQRMFAELAIRDLAVQSGWGARWLQSYGSAGQLPRMLSDWQDACLAAQTSDPLPEGPLAVVRRICEANGGTSGCWDVIAWKDNDIVFYESKRRRRDAIRGTQIRWLEAALSCGLSVEQFVVAEWDFERRPDNSRDI